MITHIVGDLLEFPNGINVLVHGANTLARMHSGIAKDIVEKWPEVRDVDTDYHNLHKGLSNILLGRYSFYDLPLDASNNIRRVVNLYQQATTRTTNPELTRHVDYEALYVGLEKLNKDFSDPSWVFGFPKKMGCNRAGGEWTVVEAMIAHIFKDRNVIIVSKSNADSNIKS